MEKNGILFITRLAVLTAIMILMDITGIGYIKTAGLELTIMLVPVLIGAMLLGPLAGALLGGVFGLTSFIQCFGKSMFGTALLAINPWYTFIVCVPTRILTGYLCGIIFKKIAEHKKEKAKSILPYAAAGISGAFLNTLFFMSALMILFGNSEYIRGFMGNMSVLPFVAAFVGLQGLIEAALCFVSGTVIARALYPVLNRK